ncbi:MAG: peroxiredoxin [Alphaproteobacteria bacterium]|nr:peroxiredoxin [Alphaproteobacteria bacterium]
MSIQDGDKAPDFSMPATGGQAVSLKALKGKPFVLYFYPKADTSGCTKEACDFNGALKQFAGKGVPVIGVSKDPMKRLEKFAAKYDLAFPLASDEGGDVTERFGAWVEKSMYGRKYMGIDRSTFLVDAKGVVRRSWRKVKVPGHVAEVLAAARAL